MSRYANGFSADPCLFSYFTFIIFLTGLIGYKLLLFLWLPYFFALFAAFIDISKIEGIFVAAPVIAYTVPSHLYYGLRFIQGLFTSNLKSSLR